MSGTEPGPPVIDLTSCDREPIHIPGSIQPHGALLALDPRDLLVVHAGGDTQRLFGAAAAALPGSAANRVISLDHVAALHELLNSGGAIMRPLRVFSMTAAPTRSTPADVDVDADVDTGVVVDVIAHQSEGLLILEFEPRLELEPGDPLLLSQGMIRRVHQANTVPAFCEALAVEVRSVTGFDRVMVYRFLPDGSGEVFAEARRPDIDSFLGLHYPASDIPRQARALYLSNWIRAIPDARYEPAPIFPQVDPSAGIPLDLSLSVLRSVSPVHRLYLANMGVVATMSLSIIMRGQLWGLVACHHYAPRHLPYRLRDCCELFAQVASSQLEVRLVEEGFAAGQRITAIHEKLVASMSRELDLATGLTRSRPNLLDFIDATGVALWIEGKCSVLGETPAMDQIEALVGWLNATPIEGVLHTDCLSELYPAASEFTERASGLLVIAVSSQPRDYVLWFRPEMLRTVTWAGNPDKPTQPGASGEILTPRASFAAWQQSARDRSSPWLAAEIQAAHRLRLSLHEVVLRRIHQILHERELARVRQEHLTRELDRRLNQAEESARALERETARRRIAEGELSQVLGRVVADQEAERLRIARELHDTLGQSLTLLQLGLDGIAINAELPEDMRRRVAALKALASTTGREVNRLAWEIRPTALDDLGIQIAIRNLLESWSAGAGLRFDLHLALGTERLPRAIETTLYRVLQEALTNVMRHARASQVSVALSVAARLITMIVEDNGAGFDIAASSGPASGAEASRMRLGLLGIRERVALVGGTFEVESLRGQGTTLFVRIPL